MRVAITFFAIVFFLSACTQRRSEPQATPQPEPVPATPAPAATPAAQAAQAPPAPVVAMSPASTLDAYKAEVAQRIYASSSELSAGRPQNLLRAVIVLNVVVDRNGQPTRITIQRTPGDAEAEQRAILSVRRAAPFPRPSNAILRGGGGVEFSETWLFNDDGRFQLRTLSQGQAGS